jgi:superfamily II DNA or RNA helicase
MSDHQRLFAAVQRAAPPRAWSRGVELARAEAIRGEPTDDNNNDAVTLRIAVKGAARSPRVTLWPKDQEWECECDSADDACFHVAAAVIALRRAHEAGLTAPLPGPRAAAVGYRLTRAQDALHFDRALLHGDGRELPLDAPLTQHIAGRVEGGPALFVTAADMTIEVTLGALSRGVLPLKTVRALLPHLAISREIQLDGAPIRVELEPVKPHLKLSDQGDDLRLVLVRAPEVDETFSQSGLARCGDRLRPIGASGLEKDQLARLRQGVIYPPSEFARLVQEILPELEKRLIVHRQSERLPKQVTGVAPRLLFDTERRGDLLQLRPLIVYGDPPIARLDGDRLTLQGRAIPTRDPEAEQRLRQQLRRALDLNPGETRTYPPGQAIDLLPKIAALGPLRGEGHRGFVRAAPLTPSIELRAGLAAATFTTQGADGGPITLDAQRVLNAWHSGDSLVPLMDGGFAPLPVDWLGRYGDHLRFLLAARDSQGRTQAWALPALAQLSADLEQPLAPELSRLRALIGDFSGLPAAQLPPDLQASLRDYQQIGVAWLQFCRSAGLGALLADDMGLGKTLQTLATFRPGERALVVAPTSVLHGWLEELRRFRPTLRVHAYYGSKRALDPDADVTVTTYALLRLDADLLQTHPTREQPWDLVVLDEAHAIKNPDSQTAQAAFQLRAEARLALTGTPVENRLSELWSLFYFLNPGLLGGRSDFDERFARPIADGAPGAAARLRARIRPFLLRRRKSEVARELPPRTELVLRCQLDRPERELYDALHLATRREVLAELDAGGGVLQALEALLRLRQASAHRGLIPGQDAATSSKVELLVDTLSEVIAEGHKALVFSQWTGLLDRVEPVLRAAGHAFVRLDGSTRDRAAVVHAFQAADGPPVMLISLKAGGTGLTLTAADHVFLLDPWWNPAVEDQAADRAHRIGQDRPVFIHRLVAEGTVEEKILELQQRKRALADAALGEGEAAATLTRADLLALLE